MNSRFIIQLMSHLRVIEVPLLVTIISILFNILGMQNIFVGSMIYAIIRLFINIRFKMQQEKFQNAILNHLDNIIDDMEEEDGV